MISANAVEEFAKFSFFIWKLSDILLEFEELVLTFVSWVP